MSQDQEIVPIGSPDSGVGDALSASLTKLLLDNNKNVNGTKLEALEGKVAEDEDVPTKQEINKKVVIIEDHPHQYRDLSFSSDEIVPSGEERETTTSPKTREERVNTIKDLLETYCSDNYLTRDIFLLKHFRRSKDGWISLKFMSSYKKIKRTAKNREEVEEAVRMSTQLEMNEDASKIRRLTPLPSCIDEYIPTRKTIIGTLAKEMRNLAVLSSFLSKYGEVASLQMLRPGVNIPDYLLTTANAFPQIRDEWCAIVEFDEIEAAGRLTSEINDGKVDNGLSWAMELVMPWKNRKSSDRQEKIQWTENAKNRCRSCPSSGYSSPCLTPDQSPLGCALMNKECRGLSKRERILMSRACQNKSPCQHGHSQHGYLAGKNGSPLAKKTYSRSSGSRHSDNGSVYTSPKRLSSHSDNGSAYNSPKRPSSHMTAETCNNWRTSPRIY